MEAYYTNEMIQVFHRLRSIHGTLVVAVNATQTKAVNEKMRSNQSSLHPPWRLNLWHALRPQTNWLRNFISGFKNC